MKIFMDFVRVVAVVGVVLYVVVGGCGGSGLWEYMRRGGRGVRFFGVGGGGLGGDGL